MFTPDDVVRLFAGVKLGVVCLDGETAMTDLPDDVDARMGAMAEALNEFTKTFMPAGAPALTLSKMQAEAVRDLLAPGWAMHSIKITAFEQLAHLPMYAATLGTPDSYKEVNAARQALAQIEYVLSALTMMKPEIDPKQFIQFLRDPDTKIIAPLYNHLMALQYADKLARAWQHIEVFQEGQAN